VDLVGKTAKYYLEYYDFRALENRDQQIVMPLNFAEAIKIRDALQSCQFSPDIGRADVIDGCTFELELIEGFNSKKFSWMDDLPAEWNELRPAIREIEKLFTAL
jgi:hypothetical protein